MDINVYLSDNIVSIIQQFGNIEEVINRILSEGSQGNIDIMNKPAAPPKVNGKNYKIHVTNPDYLELVQMFTIRSQKISIRRLVYWFFGEEVYDNLKWQSHRGISKIEQLDSLDNIDNFKKGLFDLESKYPSQKENFIKIYKILNDIEVNICHDAQ